MYGVFKKNKALLAASVLLNVVFAALAVGSAFVLEKILDAVTKQDWALFGSMIGVVAAYSGAVAVFMILTSLCTKKLVVKTVYRMRRELYHGILSRDTEHFYMVNTADYISALTNDVKTVEENVLVPLLQTIQYLLIFVMAAAGLFYYSPLIAGLMLVSLAAMYLLPSALGKPISSRQGLLSGSFSAFTVSLKDQLSGYDVIRSYQLSDRAREQFSSQNRDVSDKKYRVDRLTAVSEGISQLLGVGTQLGVMLLAAYLVLRGNMTAGMLLGIIDLSGSFVMPVSVVMQSIPKIQGARSVLERIDALSGAQPSAFRGTGEPVFAEAIRFEQVSFGYQPERPVLDCVDMTIEKNHKYAVIGASGSGKTTLVKLLTASYGGYRGRITVDGKELRELDSNRLLSMISVIHQNVYMFDETIRDNIALHRDYTRAEWEEALAVSGVAKFLGQMAEGLETPVGENGSSLSGGQRQRVAVARALIEKKPILILDEGTSAVDAHTAYDIESALLRKEDITMITITHNLSPHLLRQYDTILFVEDGRIAEAGSFDTLIRRQGRFAGYMELKEREAV